MAEETKNPFPCACVARFPKLDVFGQMSDKTDRTELVEFLKARGIETEFCDVSVSVPAEAARPAEGVVILKCVGLDKSALIPFGMLLAVAPGAQDFMIIHPQVFITFYNIEEEKAESVEGAAASEVMDAGEL